jgi:hypothetical protein
MLLERVLNGGEQQTGKDADDRDDDQQFDQRETTTGLGKTSLHNKHPTFRLSPMGSDRKPKRPNRNELITTAQQV